MRISDEMVKRAVSAYDSALPHSALRETPMRIAIEAAMEGCSIVRAKNAPSTEMSPWIEHRFLPAHYEGKRVALVPLDD